MSVSDSLQFIIEAISRSYKKRSICRARHENSAQESKIIRIDPMFRISIMRL